MHRTLNTFLKTWATPVTIGSFVLMGVTGILMFFHWDTGLNKLAHEWLGWAMIIGVLAHVLLHKTSFMKHFKKPIGLVFIVLFVLLLGLSFVSFNFVQGQGKGPAARFLLARVEQTPVIHLAPLAHLSPEELKARLMQAGVSSVELDQSLLELTHGQRDLQYKALLALLSPAS